MIRNYIGITLIAIGIMAAESDSILIPVAFIALGAWLARGFIYEQ